MGELLERVNLTGYAAKFPHELSGGEQQRVALARAGNPGRESLVEFRMDFDGSTLTASDPGVFLPRPGTVLWLMIRRDRCFVFPAG